MRYINEGWRHFARLIELKKGNLCLFELRKHEQAKEARKVSYDSLFNSLVAKVPTVQQFLDVTEWGLL